VTGRPQSASKSANWQTCWQTSLINRKSLPGNKSGNGFTTKSANSMRVHLGW
jgi:hypothetical protein